MKMAVFLLLSSPLLIPLSAYATSNTNVEVSNNGGTSYTNVEIENNTSSTNVVTNDSKTKVRIESNGKVTEYESEKPENIELKSEDGKTSVKINNESKVTTTPSSTTSAKDNENDKKSEEANKEGKNILEIIKDFLENLFNF